MYFEAELRDRKYKVDVTEGRHTWKVSLQLEGQEILRGYENKADTMFVARLVKPPLS